MESERDRTPDWLLERVSLGELSGDELKATRLRLEQEPDGPSRLAALEASDREILKAHPPKEVAAEVHRRLGIRLEEAKRAAKRRLVVRLAAAVPVAVVAVVLLALPSGPVDPETPKKESTRIKGLEPQLRVYRHTATGNERLPDRAEAREHDLLQLSYVSSGRRYGVVISVDGRGTVILHHPDGIGEAAPLEAGEEIALAHAYELDDAPRFERFILVTAREAFEARVVVEAAGKLAASRRADIEALDLPTKFSQFSLTLRKVSP